MTREYAYTTFGIELACFIVCFGLHVAMYPFHTDLEVPF